MLTLTMKTNHILMATFEKTLKEIIDSNKNNNLQIPVDIVLNNGNILLKGFRVLEFDDTLGKIKGLTMLEEYSYPRENREPVFCQISLNDIKDLHQSELYLS